jgi:hypothetical protein
MVVMSNRTEGGSGVENRGWMVACTKGDGGVSNVGWLWRRKWRVEVEWRVMVTLKTERTAGGVEQRDRGWWAAVGGHGRLMFEPTKGGGG